MTPSAVADVLQPRGCVIQSFEDHPNFFGNWRARFSHGERAFVITCDRREGWMGLWAHRPDGPGACLREVRSHTFDEAQELAVLAGWLDELLAA